MKIKPVLISGIGRSGTSAVLASMAEHKSVVKIERPGEAPFITAFLNFLIEFENRSPNSQYNVKNYRLSEEKRKNAFSEFMVLNQCGELYSENSADEEFWITKTSLSEPAFNKAIEIFDEVRCIYIMRNGIEVINSARKHAGFESLTFSQQCARWKDNIESCRHLFDRPLCAIIKHHDLVKNPLEVYTEVFDKLKMQFDSSPIEFIGGTLFNSSFDETSKGKSTTRVFENRLKGAWDSWEEDMKSQFIDHCDDLMVEFDFERPYSTSTINRNTSGSVVSSVGIVPKIQRIESNPAITPEFSERIRDMCCNRIGEPVFDYICNVSERNKFLFVNNPKVASTSILKRLQILEDSEAAAKMSTAHQRDKSPLNRLSSFLFEEQESVLYGETHFKFAFCRNPYERLLSAYLSKIDIPMTGVINGTGRSKAAPPKAQIIAAIKGVKVLDAADYALKINFHEFVEAVCQLDCSSMDSHWKPQFDVLMPDVIPYGFVGRFESLDEDLSSILDVIGVDNDELLGQSKNVTHSASKVTTYYNADIRRMVEEKFAADFHYFKYRNEQSRVVSSAA